jgi:AP-3 complex subunit delta
MSLLYECINTVIAGMTHEMFPSLSFCILSQVLVSISSGLPNHDASIQLCVQKLRILIEDSDQNCTISTEGDASNGTVLLLVKYLGLLAMSKILQTHPKSVQAHNDLIMQCLDDKDESIRLRALDLLSGMVRRSASIARILFEPVLVGVEKESDGHRA